MKIISEGYKVLGDAASIKWALVSRDSEDNDEIVSALGMFSSYGGPGRSFAKDPIARATNYSPNRVLVTQVVGLDI